MADFCFEFVRCFVFLMFWPLTRQLDGISESIHLCGDVDAPTRTLVIGNCSSDVLSNCYIKNCSSKFFNHEGDKLGMKNARYLMSPNSQDAPNWNIINLIIGAYPWKAAKVHGMHPEPSLFIKFIFHSRADLRPDKVLMKLTPIRNSKESINETVCNEIDMSESTGKTDPTTLTFDCFTYLSAGYVSKYAVYHLDIYQAKGHSWNIIPYLLFIPVDAAAIVSSSISVYRPMVVMEFESLNAGNVSFYFYPMPNEDDYRMQLKSVSDDEIIETMEASINRNTGVVYGYFEGIEVGIYTVIIIPKSCSPASEKCMFRLPVFSIVSRQYSKTHQILIVAIPAVLVVIIFFFVFAFFGISRRKLRLSNDKRKLFLIKEPVVECDIINHLHRKWYTEYKEIIDVTIERNINIETDSYTSWIENSIKTFDCVIIFVKEQLTSKRTKFCSTKFLQAYSKTIKTLEGNSDNRKNVVVFYFVQGTTRKIKVSPKLENIPTVPLNISDRKNWSYEELETTRDLIEQKLQNKIPFRVKYYKLDYIQRLQELLTKKLSKKNGAVLT